MTSLARSLPPMARSQRPKVVRLTTKARTATPTIARIAPPLTSVPGQISGNLKAKGIRGVAGQVLLGTSHGRHDRWQAARPRQKGLRKKGRLSMRSILLYLLGVPIPFIVLIALFTHHF